MKPLLGLPHWVGVVMVGTVVILIVTTAGMVSTTWVQFIKGALLVVLCSVMTGMILMRGHAQKDSLPIGRTRGERGAILLRSEGHAPKSWKGRTLRCSGAVTGGCW